MRTKWKALWGGIALTCLIILTLSPTKHSIYVDYHYYMYIGSMFLGMIVGEYEQKGVLNIKNNFMSRFFFLMAGVLCLFLYFVIIAVCKGENNPYYLFQLSALLPLLLMPLFFYCAFRGSDITQVVVRHKWLNIPIVIVSQMSLEIYIVQFLIISDTYNFLFPFNFVINYVEVILAAYVLKVLSNVFLRIFHHTSDSYLHIFVI